MNENTISDCLHISGALNCVKLPILCIGGLFSPSPMIGWHAGHVLSGFMKPPFVALDELDTGGREMLHGARPPWMSPLEITCKGCSETGGYPQPTIFLPTAMLSSFTDLSIQIYLKSR
jgi:hypothetical protein